MMLGGQRVVVAACLTVCLFQSHDSLIEAFPVATNKVSHRYSFRLQQQSSEAASTQTTPKANKILHSSPLLGDIYQIGVNDETSFVSAMEVPTFATLGPTEMREDSDDAATRARGLEGALGPNTGPALVVDNVLSPGECQDLIQTVNQLGFANYQSGKNHHGALQLVVSEQTTLALIKRVSRHLDVSLVNERRREMEAEEQQDVRLELAGLNRRWRVYKYAPGGKERFAPHIDAGFPPSGLSESGQELVWDTNKDASLQDEKAMQSSQQVVSRLTILFYLNEDFVGGETKFYQPLVQQQDEDEPVVLASVRPVTGSCLVFPQGVGPAGVDRARHHWPLHEGAPVQSGSHKYVIRSDVLFATQRQALPLDDALFQHDHLVRKAFLPQSPVLDWNFKSQIESLYNPHMGVENMGPFLYSFLRLVKKRRVVEIGAGYTSPWILQALKDNDDEMKRIRRLQENGTCRLLDIEWTEPSIVQDFDNEPARLLCIDNCEHQKETATGAMAIARSLGLSDYMEFVLGDAFDMHLESVDVLWCDFGVGSRMREFVARAWPSLRPGGFLLCHSTLTNRRTRAWLEAARMGQDVTGIPPGECEQVSLLEPHKHFQNSISIFQKRKNYTEPIYSEYA